MATRRSHRLIAAAVLIAVGGILAGCSSSSFDPTDMFNMFDTKKKLPGQRQPVFPEGVPGLEQGVPRDLYKENVDRQQLLGQETAPVEAAPPPVVEEAPKPRASSRPRAAHPPAAAATPPASKPAPRTVRRRSTTVPEDDAPAAAPEPQVQPPAQPQTAPPPPATSSPFPAPLPSGSFQR